MVSETEIVKTVEKMLKNEVEESELFLDLMTKTDNVLVKHLFRWVMLDSLMHQDVMTTVKSYLEGKTPSGGTVAGSQSQFAALAREEGEVKKTAEWLIPNIEDKGVQLLLRLLALDEDKHGKILAHVRDSYRSGRDSERQQRKNLSQAHATTGPT